MIMAAASFVRRHAAAPTKGRAIRCTVDGSTPKRLAIPRTPSPVRSAQNMLISLGSQSRFC